MANVLIIEKVGDNLFSHKLNDEQSVIDNNPNLTSFLNADDNTEWLDFKTKNGAPLIKQQRIKPQEITIIDTFGGTGTFTGFTNALAIWIKLSELGYFVGYGIAGGGSGVNRFRNLLDVYPLGTYSGQNNKVYVVNESQQRLDATTFYNKRLFSELEDVATGALNTNMAGKILQISIVSGVAKVTLANMPGFSDSLKQTYKLRFSNDDAPDRPTLVSLLNSYTDSPFDNGLVPNDMGGILIEIYDSVTDETLMVYELIEVSAGSSLTEVGDNNLILLTQSSGSIGINDVLQTDSVAVDKTQTFEDSGSDDLMILSPSGVVTTNTTKNTTYEAEGIIHGEVGFVSSDFFETPTQNNARIIPNKSGTYAMISDILTRALTGLSLVTGGVISATDTILQAFGKLQNQISKNTICLFIDTVAKSYTVAGTTTVVTFTIPANTIPANCMIRTFCRFYKTGTNLNFSVSLASTSMPQARIINNVNSGSNTNTFMQIGRENIIGGGKIRGFDTSGSTYHTFAANNAVYANVDFDVTIAQTFNLTINTSSTTDTIIFDALCVEMIRT